MDWKPFVCRVSCSKIKQKLNFWTEGTPIYWSLGSNIMEPGLQYIGAHQIFLLHNRLVGQKYFFVITQMRFNKTHSIWIGLIQLKKWFSMCHKIMSRNLVVKGLQCIGAHQIFLLHNRLVGQKYFFVITQMRFTKTQSIWIGFIQLKKGFSMSHKIMFRSAVVKGLQYNGARAPIYWSPSNICHTK